MAVEYVVLHEIRASLLGNEIGIAFVLEQCQLAPLALVCVGLSLDPEGRNMGFWSKLQPNSFGRRRRYQVRFAR